MSESGKKEKTIPFGKRVTDKFIDPIGVESLAAKKDEFIGGHQAALAAKDLLQKVLWERAKGELNAVIACCTASPETEQSVQIIDKARDVMLIMDHVIYEWSKLPNDRA